MQLDGQSELDVFMLGELAEDLVDVLDIKPIGTETRIQPKADQAMTWLFHCIILVFFVQWNTAHSRILPLLGTPLLSPCGFWLDAEFSVMLDRVFDLDYPGDEGS